MDLVCPYLLDRLSPLFSGKSVRPVVVMTSSDIRLLLRGNVVT